MPQRSTWDFILARREVIAVVDDDLMIREALDRLLSSLGYRAELYTSAAEFIAAALTTEASCLLLDVQLGAMTGIELARHLIFDRLQFFDNLHDRIDGREPPTRCHRRRLRGIFA